jgi:hypothetical protein
MDARKGAVVDLVSRRPHMSEPIEHLLDRLRRNPCRPVRTRLGDMEVEIRVVDRGTASGRLGDRIASLGPWSGETSEEVSALLEGIRRAGGAAEPPPL